jgi:hypothetical protein
MSYEIPQHLPQPTGYDTDGSPYWDSDGGRWTNRGWIVPLERLPQYIVPPEPPAPQPDPVPQVITRRQLHLALSMLESRTRAEVDATVRGIIAQVPGTDLERDRILSSWLDSGTIDRENADTQLLMYYLSQTWGMTQEQVDAVFRLGATL